LEWWITNRNTLPSITRTGTNILVKQSETLLPWAERVAKVTNVPLLAVNQD